MVEIDGKGNIKAIGGSVIDLTADAVTILRKTHMRIEESVLTQREKEELVSDLTDSMISTLLKLSVGSERDGAIEMGIIKGCERAVKKWERSVKEGKERKGVTS